MNFIVMIVLYRFINNKERERIIVIDALPKKKLFIHDIIFWTVAVDPDFIWPEFG